MFFKRSYQKEMMDDFSIDDKRIDDALNELKIINKYLGGRSVSKSGFKKIRPYISSGNSIKILDAGGGASDNLLALKENNCQLISLDLSKGTTKYLKKNSPETIVICSDIFNLPFKKKQFDVSHLALFLHHFNEREIIEILYSISAITKEGIIINDLRRSVFAYAGIKILTMFFSKSEFVKNDGPLSVKKGFMKSELKEILNKINFKYKIQYKWAFRWLVVIYLNNEKKI